MKNNINYYIICNKQKKKKKQCIKAKPMVTKEKKNRKPQTHRNPPFLKVIFSLSVEIMKTNTNVL